MKDRVERTLPTPLQQISKSSERSRMVCETERKAPSPHCQGEALQLWASSDSLGWTLCRKPLKIFVEHGGEFANSSIIGALIRKEIRME